MPKFALGPWLGITDQKWSGSQTEFETLQHFDIWTDSYRLIPNRSLEQDEGEDKAKLITQFAYVSKIYGLGKTGSKLAIYEKSSVDAASWTASTNGSPSVNSLAVDGLFKHYKDSLLGVRGTATVWRWQTTGTFTDTVGSLTGTPSYIGQGLIANDDNFYIPYDYYIAKVDSSFSLSATALTLPSHLVCRSIENKGNYLAIGCTGDGLTKNSIMYLWDMISADPTERVDWGLEELQVIGNIGGYIVGLSLTESSSLASEQYLVVKVWSGGEKATQVASIPLGRTGYSLMKNKFIIGEVMYFGLNVNSDAEDLKGVWSVGQNKTTGEWFVSQELKMINDTKITTLESIFRVADYWFIAHSTDGSVEHTNDAATYAATSTLESSILTDPNGSTNNKIKSVSAIFEALAGGTVTVDVSSNGGSYKTVISTSTTGAVRAEKTKLASGSPFDEFSYLQIRVKSTGGAVIHRVVVDYDTGIQSSVK